MGMPASSEPSGYGAVTRTTSGQIGSNQSHMGMPASSEPSGYGAVTRTTSGQIGSNQSDQAKQQSLNRSTVSIHKRLSREPSFAARFL